MTVAQCILPRYSGPVVAVLFVGCTNFYLAVIHQQNDQRDARSNGSWQCGRDLG